MPRSLFELGHAAEPLTIDNSQNIFSKIVLRYIYDNYILMNHASEKILIINYTINVIST